MQELWVAATAWANLPLTLLLGLVVVYWLTVILGVLDIDDLDFDLDVDADVEADVGADAQAGSVWLGFLRFMDLGDVPFMLVISIFTLIMWTVAMAATLFLGLSGWMGFAAYVPFAMVALLVTKVFTVPLARLFRTVNNQGKAVKSVVGQLCMLRGSASDSRLAQGEVNTGGSPFLVTVRTRAGEVMPKGSKGIIVEKVTDKDIYIVEPFNDWE